MRAPMGSGARSGWVFIQDKHLAAHMIPLRFKKTHGPLPSWSSIKAGARPYRPCGDLLPDSGDDSGFVLRLGLTDLAMAAPSSQFNISVIALPVCRPCGRRQPPGYSNPVSRMTNRNSLRCVFSGQGGSRLQRACGRRSRRYCKMVAGKFRRACLMHWRERQPQPTNLLENFHGYELSNSACLRRNVLSLVRRDRGLLVCRAVAGSERPPRVNAGRCVSRIRGSAPCRSTTWSEPFGALVQKRKPRISPRLSYQVFLAALSSGRCQFRC